MIVLWLFCRHIVSCFSSCPLFLCFDVVWYQCTLTFYNDLLCDYCRFFPCGYHEDFVKRFTDYFSSFLNLTLCSLPSHVGGCWGYSLRISYIVYPITEYDSSGYVYCILTFKVVSELCTTRTVLQNWPTINLPWPVSFMFPAHVFMMLIGILLFPPRKPLLSISRRAGLVAVSSVHFCLLRKVFISPHFWRIAVSGIEFLVNRVFFVCKYFEYIILFSLGPKSLWWKITPYKAGSFCVTCLFSLVALKVLSLSSAT